MYRRPNLYTSYSAETSILPTWTQRVAMVLLAVIAVLLPFSLPVIDQIPFVRYLGDSDWLRVTTSAVIFAVAALGLNLLTGVAGQVSLGHSFFMGVGAYTAVFLGGEASSRPGATGCRCGCGFPVRDSAPRSWASSSLRRPSACAACTSPSSPSGWCSSASTCHA